MLCFNSNYSQKENRGSEISLHAKITMYDIKKYSTLNLQFTTVSLTLELYDVIFYVIILYKKDDFVHFFIAKMKRNVAMSI